MPFFHQGDDGSRWTSAFEFRKSTELSDTHIRKDVHERNWLKIRHFELIISLGERQCQNYYVFTPMFRTSYDTEDEERIKI